MIDFSTELNGVMISARHLDRALAQYVDNLVLINSDPIFKISLCGSATPLRYRGHFFLACCRHQLSGRELSDVAILKRDGSVAVTSAGVRHLTQKTDSDYSDLAIFDFTEPCRSHIDLQHRFFNFREIPPIAPNTETIFVQANGYPSGDQKYELEELNHIGLLKRKIICELDRQPTDDALLRLKHIQRLDFSPDGMSGGSAFTVQIVNGKPKAFFAGMTVRGDRDYLHILKSGYIRALLDSILEPPPVQERRELGPIILYQRVARQQ